MFYFLIVDRQDRTNNLRNQYKNGEFKKLYDLPDHWDLLSECIALYKASSQLGTINFGNNDKNMGIKDYMSKHNINEHLIIISLNELTRGNFY